jgi:hypothetical protein
VPVNYIIPANAKPSDVNTSVGPRISENVKEEEKEEEEEEEEE